MYSIQEWYNEVTSRSWNVKSMYLFDTNDSSSDACKSRLWEMNYTLTLIPCYVNIADIFLTSLWYSDYAVDIISFSPLSSYESLLLYE